MEEPGKEAWGQVGAQGLSSPRTGAFVAYLHFGALPTGFVPFLKMGAKNEEESGVRCHHSLARVIILSMCSEATSVWTQGRQRCGDRGGSPHPGTRVTARQRLAGMRRENGILIAQIKCGGARAQ